MGRSGPRRPGRAWSTLGRGVGTIRRSCVAAAPAGRQPLVHPRSGRAPTAIGRATVPKGRRAQPVRSWRAAATGTSKASSESGPASAPARRRSPRRGRRRTARPRRRSSRRRPARWPRRLRRRPTTAGRRSTRRRRPRRRRRSSPRSDTAWRSRSLRCGGGGTGAGGARTGRGPTGGDGPLGGPLASRAWRCRGDRRPSRAATPRRRRRRASGRRRSASAARWRRSTSSATAGIRDEPPTSSTPARSAICSPPTPRPAPARRACRPCAGARPARARRGRRGSRCRARARRRGSTSRCPTRAPPWRRCTRPAAGPARRGRRDRCVSSSRSCPSRAASTWASTAWSTSTPPRRSSPSGVPEQLGPVVAVADDGGVERPAAEVEHGDGLARLEPAEAGVVAGGGLGLGHQLDVVDAGDAAGLPEQVELELAPVRRVGQRDGCRAARRPGDSAVSTTWRRSWAISASAPYGTRRRARMACCRRGAA